MLSPGSNLRFIDHCVSDPFRFPVDAIPIDEHIIRCGLRVRSKTSVIKAEGAFPHTEEMPDEQEFQFFEFDSSISHLDAIGFLLAMGYVPGTLDELLSWEWYFRWHAEKIREVIRCPYPLFGPGQPSQSVNGIQYIPRIDQHKRVHTLGFVPFLPSLPRFGDGMAYYVIARCPDWDEVILAIDPKN